MSQAYHNCVWASCCTSSRCYCGLVKIVWQAYGS